MSTREPDLASAVALAHQLAFRASRRSALSLFRADVLPHLLAHPAFAAAWNAAKNLGISAAAMREMGLAEQKTSALPLPLALAEHLKYAPAAFQCKLLPLLCEVPACDAALRQLHAWRHRFALEDWEVLAHEAPAAERALGDFLATPPEAQGQALAASPQGWCFCLLLLEVALEGVGNLPEEGQRLAQLAVELAERQAELAYGAEPLAQLQALAHAHLGNALRVAGRLEEARATFARAEALLAPVCQPLPRLWAEARNLYGAFLLEERSFAAARVALEEARTLGWQSRNVRVAARSELMLAALDSEAGQHEAAAARMAALLPRLQPEADPRVYGLTHYALANYHLRAGQPEAAAGPLAAARPWLALHGNRSDRVRLNWLEALRLRRLDQEPAQVVHKMNAAVQGFLDLGRLHSAAVAALELALLHLELGQTAEVRALAEEIYPVFDREGVEREAQATVLAFHQAVRQEELTVEVMRGLLGKMERVPG